MENQRKVWYDQNSQPPKNYIWYKNGQYLEWIDDKWVANGGLNPNTTYVDSKTGSLSNLTTTNKNNLVAAINEVKNSSAGCFAIHVYGNGGDWVIEDEGLDESTLYQHVGESIMIIFTDQSENETNVSYIPAVVRTHSGEASSISVEGNFFYVNSDSLEAFQITIYGEGDGTLRIQTHSFFQAQS